MRSWTLSRGINRGGNRVTCAEERGGFSLRPRRIPPASSAVKVFLVIAILSLAGATSRAANNRRRNQSRRQSDAGLKVPADRCRFSR